MPDQYTGEGICAGWAAKDITPYGRRVNLFGQYYDRMTQELESRLMVTVLLLQNENSTLIWAACDLLGISKLFVSDVKKAIVKKAPHICTDNLILSATHTHTAPAILYNEKDKEIPNVPGVMSAFEYHSYVADIIADTVIKAEENKKTGHSIVMATAPVMTGCCRRGIINTGEGVMYIDTKRPDFTRMEGPDGGPLNFFYLYSLQSILNGVIAFIPCPAQVLEHQSYISSDYAGRLRQMLQEKYGDDFFFLPLITAAGDLSPRNLVTKDHGYANMYSKDGADEMAKRIYDAICASESHPAGHVYDFDGSFVKQTTVELPGWIPSSDEYELAVKSIKSKESLYDIKDYIGKTVEPYFGTPLALAKNSEAAVYRHTHADICAKVSATIFALRLGDTVIITNPFELFCQMGARISAACKAKSVLTVQLVQDSLGYFPTVHAAKAGGYGANITSCNVDPYSAGDILVKESVRLADSLYFENKEGDHK